MESGVPGVPGVLAPTLATPLPLWVFGQELEHVAETGAVTHKSPTIMRIAPKVKHQSD